MLELKLNLQKQQQQQHQNESLRDTNRFIADRMKVSSPSSTVSLADKAKALKKKGIDLLDLTVGQPHFDTPEKVKESAKNALDSGFTFYTESSGLPDLIEGLRTKLEEDNKIYVKPSEILVTVGAKEAVFDAVFCTINEGDEVLIPDPYWNTYFECVKLAGATPVPVPMSYAGKEGGFRFDPQRMQELVTKRTKMVILNSPHNPTGMVLQKGELESIAKICMENDLLAVSDEIYEKIIYDGSTHYSIGSFEGMGERTLTINGFSKAYAMTGWRLGYAAGPKEIIDKMKILHQHTVTHPASFAQKAALVALTCTNEVAEMRKEYQKLRDLFVNSLQKNTDLLEVSKPEGTFYSFPKIRKGANSSPEMADLLLEKAHIVCVPGSSFGSQGGMHLRFVFANSHEVLERVGQQLSWISA